MTTSDGVHEPVDKCDPAIRFSDNYGWNLKIVAEDTNYKNRPIEKTDDSLEYISCQIGNINTAFCYSITFEVGLWQSDLGIQWEFFSFCQPKVSVRISYVTFN